MKTSICVCGGVGCMGDPTLMANTLLIRATRQNLA